MAESRFEQMADTAAQLLKEMGYVHYEVLANTHYKRKLSPKALASMREDLKRVVSALRKRRINCCLVGERYPFNGSARTNDMTIARAYLPNNKKSVGIHLALVEDCIYAASQEANGRTVRGKVIAQSERNKTGVQLALFPALKTTISQVPYTDMLLDEELPHVVPMLPGPGDDDRNPL